jgi:hypothetical protein
MARRGQEKGTPMEMRDWLQTFSAMHDRAKAGKLTPAELANYKAGRDDLARVLLAAQRATIKEGEIPRRSLRASRALQVDLELGSDTIRGVTLDISAGGFGMLVARRPTASEGKCSLRLPGGDVLAGHLRLVHAKQQPGNTRVSFAFTNLSSADAERLETVVFDTVISQLAP